MATSSTSDENFTTHSQRTRLTPEQVMEILVIQESRGEHGHFLPTETGFSSLSKEERRQYEPTPEQLEEAKEILRLEELKDKLHGIMDQLEFEFGVTAFAVASGPVQTKESVYFASPSARPFIEYDYNRMRDRPQDECNIFYRWKLLLHLRDSFFAGDVNGPVKIKPGSSAATSDEHKVKPDTPDATMRKVVRRLVENVTGQTTDKIFSEKTIEEFLHQHGFRLLFSADWDLTRVKRAYETRSHPLLCREVIKAVEDGKIRVVRFQ
ncbi:hypothetical protein V1506DRAFT_563009 [Lipomyces tetrasporus]